MCAGLCPLVFGPKNGAAATNASRETYFKFIGRTCNRYNSAKDKKN
jgi:hypothetical protein